MMTAGVLGAGVAAIVVSVVNPWPAALLIRKLFERGADDTAHEMTAHVPQGGVETRFNIAYDDEAKGTKLDIYSPIVGKPRLPVVVWVHGGAWISGDKKHVGPYVKILASHGYVAASLDYTVAPTATYPTALKQLNAALDFLVRHSAEYRIDPSRIILAGDSAGAQLVSQLANIITNPSFADAMDVVPAIRPTQLRGMILNCGIFDVSGIPKVAGINGYGFRIALWAYLGKKNWSHTAGGAQMSSVNYVTSKFPPTWISGGNGDALTNVQSKPFAARLKELGVAVTELFFAENHEPAVPHEYQFHLNMAEARAALTSTVKFLAEVSG